MNPEAMAELVAYLHSMSYFGTTFEWLMDGVTVYGPSSNDYTEQLMPLVSELTVVLFEVIAHNGDTEVRDSIDVIVAPPVLPPTITPGGSSSSPYDLSVSEDITIEWLTEGATVHYTTDGSDPTTDSQVFDTAFALPYGATTVKAFAVRRDGYNDSEVVTAYYNWVIPPPTFVFAREPDDGDYYNNTVTVEVVKSNEGNIVRYAFKNYFYSFSVYSSSPEYTEPVLLEPSDSVYRYKFKAKEFTPDGLASSEVAEVEVRLKVGAPVATPSQGTYSGSVEVDATTITEDAVIRYVTGAGSSVRYDSPVWTGPMTFDSSTTLKFKAFKDGWSSSEEVSVTYTISGGS